MESVPCVFGAEGEVLPLAGVVRRSANGWSPDMFAGLADRSIQVVDIERSIMSARRRAAWTTAPECRYRAAVVQDLTKRLHTSQV